MVRTVLKMQKKRRRRKEVNHNALIIAIAILIIAAASVALFLSLNSKAALQPLPDMSSYGFLNGNYTMNSTSCGRYNSGEICTEILYRSNNVTYLPATVALASYVFSNNESADNYLSSMGNSTTLAFTGSNRTFIYTSLPFINGQIVFTALVAKGNIVYSASALFDPFQQTGRAEPMVSDLVYRLAYG